MKNYRDNGLVRPKKALGQHFLVDLNIARNIVDALGTDHDVVIEVGAGMGVLTQYLIENQLDKLQVVEIDSESVEFLKNKFPMLEGHLIHGDFLKQDLTSFRPTGGSGEMTICDVAVIGNFPYNISSQIFFQILKYRNNVSECVGMIQKEVAERLAAGPGSKTYGILSVLLQAWYDIEYLFTVHENVFNPPPKVKSAVIRLKRNNVKELGCDEKLFVTVVKQAFNQRRKTLRNSLRSLIPTEIIDNEIFNKRPEQLSVAEFVELTQLLDKQ
ncbi:MAG: 16S rRNA (adenine(1518)-N(6)/adenine(1519)-N(6))-dimethyltransferase RsmA [Bacteroidales bacterium]|nr:16S rRNA (adenine(1518)-N(6)/adenine(1519)-N(6))-dimethyltransferase RsmA [Bacteroidales bacterium]